MLLERPLVQIELLRGYPCVLLRNVLLVRATVFVEPLDLLVKQALPHLGTLLNPSDALADKLLQLGRKVGLLGIGQEDCVLQ